jgi:TatD DNase family protein
MLNPAIDLASSRKVVELAEQYAEVYAAVGVHPNSAATWDAETMNELRKLAQRPKVVAIGEIGLDYYRDRAPRYVQEQVFQYQLDLAAELGLPVIVHNREATADVLRKLEAWHAGLLAAGSPLAERPGVLHSYSGKIGPAAQAVRRNFYVGFTGPVTFKNAEDLREVARQVDIGSILIETDAPFLTPHPHRGKRIEPGYVRLIAEKLAELKSLDLGELAAVTSQNAVRLFAW